MGRFPNSEFMGPVVGSLGAVLLTTTILLILDAHLEAQHLVIGYLVPTTVIAILYGSTLAFIASAASSIAAAYFLFPPKFSLYIASPLHVAELGFFILLAVIASKVTALLTHDLQVRKSRVRPGGEG
jgi:K+-sensing histidine kinase KdpD